MEEYKGSILIVDDEESLRTILLRKLESEGYNCVTVSNGVEALQTAATQDFDLVLLDVKMQGKSGIEVLSQITTDHPNTCVIMTTAVADGYTAIESMKLGAYDYITKPYELEDLKLRVEKALERKQLLQENRDYKLRLTEDALKESQDKYERLSEAMSEGYVVIQNLKVIFANSSSTQILGYTPGETMGKSIADILPSDVITSLAETHKKRLRGESVPGNFEITLPKKDGSPCPVELGVRLIEHEGKPAVAMVIRDMTERKQAEKALRKSEEKWRSLAENAPSVIITVDIDGTIQFINRNVLGFTPEETIGNKIYEYMEPEYHRIAEEAVERAFKEGKYGSYEIKGQGTSGQTSWYDTQVGPIKSGGKVIAATLFITDITKRKQAAEDINFAFLELRQIFNTAPSGMCVIDKDFTMLRVNDTYCSLLDIKRDEILGKKCNEIMPGAMCQTEDCPLTCILSGEERVEHDTEKIRRDGTKVPCHLEATPFIGPDGKLIGIVESFTDISERKYKEEQLKILSSVIEQSTNSIAILDKEGVIEYANPKLFEIYGLNPEDFIGKNFRSLISEHSSLHKEYSSIQDTVLEKGMVWKKEITDKTKSSESIWREATIFPIRNTNGEISHLAYTSYDITERKQAEETLRQQEEHFRALIENSAVGILVINGDGTIRYTSPSHQRITGFSLDERAGADSLGKVHPDDKAQAAEVFTRLFQNPGSSETIELNIQHKDGSWKFVRAIGTNLLENPAVKGIVVNFEDITDSKKAEEELIENEEKYKHLFENANDAIFIMDVSEEHGARFLDCNDRTLKLFGCTRRNQIIGKTPLDFSPPTQPDGQSSQGKVRDIASAVIEGHPQFFEWSHSRLDGTPFWVEVTCNRLELKGKYYMQAFVRDITERKKAEETLRIKNSAVESSINAIAMIDLSGMLTYVNPAFLKMWDYTNDTDVLGRPATEFWQEEEQVLTLVMEFGKFLGEVVAIKQDGSIFNIQLASSLVKDDSGNPLCTMVSMQNITERKQTEEALRESEERYRLLAENATDVIFTASPDLSIDYVSPSVTSLLGYTVEQVKKMSLDKLLTPASLELAMEHITDDSDMVGWNKLGEPWSIELEMELRHKEGHTICTEVTTGLLCDQEGQPFSYLGIIRDISERKRAEKELSKNEEYFRSLMAHSSDAIIVLNEDGSERFRSPSTTRMLGYRDEEKVSISVFDVIHPDDFPKVSASFSRMLENPGVPTYLESRVKHKDGSWLQVVGKAKNLLNDPIVQGIIINLRDSTERREAETAFTESEERLRGFMDSATDGFSIWDSKMKCLDANTVALKYFGKSIAAVRGKSMASLSPGITKTDRYKKYLEVIKTGESAHFDYAITMENHGEWNFSISAFKVGEGLGLITSNITKRKRTEKALSDSEERYRLIAENATDVIFTSDMNFKITYVSPSIERQRGFTVAEAMARPLDESFTPASLEHSINVLSEELALENREDTDLHRTRTEEFEVYRKDGSTMWAEFKTAFLHDENGTPIGILGSSRDVTERKKTEEALRESEEKYRTILESIEDGYYEVDIKGNMTLFNDATCRILGYSRKQLQGMNNREFMNPETSAEVYKVFNNVFKTGKPERGFEWDLVGKKGRVRTAETSLSLIKDNNDKPVGFRGILRDITERKQAKEALQESELNLNRAQQMAHIGSWIWDIASNRTIWSEEMYRIFDMSRELEPSPDYVRTIIHPDDLNMFNNAMEKSFGSDPITHLEFRIVLADDTVKWVRSSAEFLYNHNGDLTQVAGSIQDITERKEADQALRESEEKYRLITDTISDVISVTDASLNVIYVSPSIERLRGYTPEEVVKIPLEESISPECYQKTMESAAQNIAAVKAGDTTIKRIETDLIHKDGSIVPVEMVMNALFDDAGKLTHFITSMRDIYDRKQAEEALKESETKFRQIFENSADEILYLDPQGNIIDVNPVAETIWGYSVEELVGHSLTEIGVFDQEQLEQISELFVTASANGTNIVPLITFQGTHKDGHMVYADIKGSIITSDDGEIEGFLCIIRDVTERKQAEEALRIKENALENSLNSIAMSDMAGNITYANRATREWCLSNELGDVIGKPYHSLLKMDDKAILDEIATGMLEKGYWEGELLSQNADGEEIWIQVYSSMVKDDQGNPIHAVSSFADTTKRKLAEKSLRESEEKYRLVTDNISDVITVVDINLNTIYVSPSVERLRGYTPEEAISIRLKDSISAEDYEKVAINIMQDIATAKEENFTPARTEVAISRKDGSLVPVELMLTSVLDKSGEITHFITTMRDITKRKLAEKALRESEEKYRLVTDNISDVITVTDINLNVIYVSPSMMRLQGYSPEEAMKRTLEESISPESYNKTIAEITKNVAKAKTGDITYRAIETELVHKDGHLVPVELVTTTIFDNNGEISHFVTSMRDIGDRKQAEAALQDSEKRYRLLAENASDIIWTANMDLQLTYISPSVQRHRGYSVEEALNQRIDKMFTPASFELAMQGVSEGLGREYDPQTDPSRFRTMELEMPCKDGSTIWTETSASMLRDSEGQAIGLMGLTRNITERKQAEKDLQDSEKRFRSLIENSSDVIALVNNEGIITYLSPSAERLSGFTNEEQAGTSMTNFIHPDDLDTVAKEFTDVIANPGSTISLELRIQHKNGTFPWIEATATNLLEDPKINAIVCNYRDITERKQAEEELKNAEEYFRALIENSEDAIVVINSDGSVRYTSPSYKHVLGYDPDDRTNSGLFYNIHPDDMPKVTEEFSNIFKKPGGALQVEIRAQHADGSWRWIEAVGVNHLEDPAVTGIVVNMRDITERKQSENILQESEEKYRFLTENINDLIAMTDMEGRYLYVNEAYRRIGGYDPEKLIGQQCFDYVHPEDRDQAVEVLINQGTNNPTFVCRYLCSDGSYKWLHVHCGILYGENGLPEAGLSVGTDINNLKQIEESLQKSWEEYEALVSNIADAILKFRETATIWCNDKAEVLFGYTKEELIGKEIDVLLPKDASITEYKKSAIKETKDQNLFHNVIKVTKKDGTQIDVEYSVSRIPDTDPIEFVAVVRDITERLKAEEALRNSEKRFKEIFNNVSDMIFYVNSKGNYLNVNQRAFDLFGVSPEELIGSKFSQSPYLHSADLKKTIRTFKECVARGEPMPRHEMRALHKKGHKIFAELTIQYISTADGELMGYLGMIRDITDSRKAEQALRDSEERFRALIEKASDSIALVDKNGLIQYQSPSVVHITGFTGEEQINVPMSDLIHPDDLSEASRLFAGILKENGSSSTFELRTIHKDGSWVWIEVTATNLLKDLKVGAIVCNYRDITDRRQSQDWLQAYAEDLWIKKEELDFITKDLMQKNQELNVTHEQLTVLNENLEQRVQDRTVEVQRLLEHKDEFITRLGHDLKSPLTPLVTLLPLIAKREQDVRQKELLDMSIDNVNYMKDLVVKTLQLERFSSPNATLNTENIKLRDEFDNSIKGKLSYIKKKRIHIDNRVDEIIKVRSDRMGLTELIDNLITNAIKYTPDGGSITFDAKKQKNLVTVSIKDTGIGLSGDQIEHIYEEFYKADRSRHELDSSGLGLAICKRIVEKQGGKIWAESDGPDKGSTFNFTIKSAKTTTKNVIHGANK